MTLAQDEASQRRVEAARDLMRAALPGVVFTIGFRRNKPRLWLLLKNDRFEVTLMSLEDGQVVTNQIVAFSEMTRRGSDAMSLELWE